MRSRAHVYSISGPSCSDPYAPARSCLSAAIHARVGRHGAANVDEVHAQRSHRWCAAHAAATHADAAPIPARSALRGGAGPRPRAAAAGIKADCPAMPPRQEMHRHSAQAPMDQASFYLLMEEIVHGELLLRARQGAQTVDGYGDK